MTVPPRGPRPARSPLARRLHLESLEAREVPAVGVLDPDFATGGKLTTDDLGYTPVDVATDALGRAVVVGTINGPGGTQDFIVSRFTAAGALDTAFGSSGKRLIDFDSSTDEAAAVALTADGVIVVAGTSDGSVAVAAVDGDGDLLNSFDADGRNRFSVAGANSARAADVAILPTDGTIVVVGSSTDAGGDRRFSVVGVTPAGTAVGSVRLDPVTGGTGREDFANAVTIDAQNRIVIAGQSRGTNGNLQASAYRLAADGDPDNTFGTGGSVALTGGVLAGLTARALAVDTDAAGNVYLGIETDTTGANGSVGVLAIAKLAAADGDLDAAYGDSGVFLSPFTGGGGQPGIVGVQVLPGGQVLAAGSSTPEGTTGIDFLVLQTTAAGDLDPVFNATGTDPGALFIDFAGNNDPARGLALDSSGRAVVVGIDLSTNDVNVARVIAVEPASPPPPPAATRLAVGGSAGGTARVYAPDAGGKFANPPVATTPAGVFPGFGGEVRVATGDFNGDGTPDTVMVTGPGTRTVMAVVNGADNTVIVPATDPFGDANFTFGGFVTAGDIDRDGRAEWVITPELRGGPRVIIFRLLANGTFDITSAGQPSLVANFFGIGDPTFRDGDRAALGDVNGDGTLDVFSIAAFNGGPRTALYNGADVLVHRAAGRDPVKLTGDFFAAPSGADEGRGGRSIAAGDVDGDGRADLIVTGDNFLGTGNQIVIFSGAQLIAGQFPGFGATPLANFAVNGLSPGALASVTTTNADGDARADLVVGSGAGQASLVKVYAGTVLAGAAEPASVQFDPFGAATLNGVFVG